MALPMHTQEQLVANMRNWTPPALPTGSSSDPSLPTGPRLSSDQPFGNRRFESNQSSRLGSFMAEDPKFETSGDSSSESTEPALNLPQRALVSVVWKELTVLTPERCGRGRESMLLKGVKGFAEPRSMLAVVGPADSGRSILLAVLARRAQRPAQVHGNIFINGVPLDHSHIQPTYCGQDDALPSHLTVEQALAFTVRLQIPNHGGQTVRDLVHDAAQHLGLLGDMHKMTHLLPVGMRRRVATACQLINCTPLLILHDVLFGVNEGDALAILRAIQNHCREGCTAIISVQHPSTDMCSFFTKAYVLCAGELVFFGDTGREALEQLSAAGMPCPPLYSPIEQYMRLLDPSFEVYLQVPQGDPETIKARFSSMMFKVLQGTYVASAASKRLGTRTLDMATEKTDPSLQEYAMEYRSMWAQTCVLSARWLAQGRRCANLYSLRLLGALLLALCYGGTYSQLSRSASGLEDRLVVLFLAAGVVPLLTLLARSVYSNSTRVYARERNSAHVSVAAHVLAKAVLDLPLLFVVAALSAVVLIPLASLSSSSSAWGYFILVVWLALLAADAMVRAVAVVLSCADWQRAVLLLLFGVQLLSCGYFTGAGRGLNLVIGTVAFPAWAFKGLVRNEVEGTNARWGCVGDGVRTLPGTQCAQAGGQVWQHLSGDFGVTPASKWHAVWVLIGLYVAWELIHLSGLLIRARLARGTRVQAALPRPAIQALKNESNASIPGPKDLPDVELGGLDPQRRGQQLHSDPPSQQSR